MKPNGKVKVVEFFPGEANDTAAFADIIAEDESGVKWCFSAACFSFELKPYNPAQEIPFSEYHHSVLARLRKSPYWSNLPISMEMTEVPYREGDSIEEAAFKVDSLIRKSYANIKMPR